MPPASFVPSDLLMDSSSGSFARPEDRPQDPDPDKAVSPGFEILLCHVLAVSLQFVSKAEG